MAIDVYKRQVHLHPDEGDKPLLILRRGHHPRGEHVGKALDAGQGGLELVGHIGSKFAPHGLELLALLLLSLIHIYQVLPSQVHLRDVRKHFAPAPALLPPFQGLIVRRLDLGRRRLTHQVGHHALHQGAQFQLVQI